MNAKPKSTPRIRGTTPEIEAAARRLRRNMTPAEQKLWQALRRRQLGGLKFRAQHPVGKFILDFYCPACKLAVEVDGDVHDHQKDFDAERDRVLAEYGYSVLRFHNEDVMENLQAVLHRIREVAQALLPPESGGRGAGGRTRQQRIHEE